MELIVIGQRGSLRGVVRDHDDEVVLTSLKHATAVVSELSRLNNDATYTIYKLEKLSSIGPQNASSN